MHDALSAPSALDRFGAAYAEHRAVEGRALAGDALLALPYLTEGPLARQWQVRARTFEAFRARTLTPMIRAAGRPLRILDLGAGNGWLSYRLACDGHYCTAADIRNDAVDGLGAAEVLRRRVPFETLVASFDALPLCDGMFDVALFNAALHYATDLAGALAEARRVTRRGGIVAILDSPFYASEIDGTAMVVEKHARASATFGGRADALLGLPFIEFLTRNRLTSASAPLRLRWRRHRVRYPLWYELRPIDAWRRGRRAPSRFDYWTAVAR